MRLDLRIKHAVKHKVTAKKIRKKTKIILSALEFDNAPLSVLITDDKEIQEINKKWLQQDRPTDVIAFSQLQGEPCPTQFMGDVVISAETADRQANELGHSLDHEMNRLLAHGILHLAGYDHVHGGRQARKMRELEDQLVDEIETRETNK